ncbi:MAG: tRNA (adenosine(37)-N6)-threonylcarbamoyltransferase complex transferase subunit TsaD [Patescibacteria group bacterium]|nr:tRNA (adenosine(37)-N6)-threonylcarbamoyltransferase complex transferase subunit TsaD [Patescibacteria group bacterium]
MKILAIETSCDDTAIAVIQTKNGKKFKVLSNLVMTQDIHNQYGGVFPKMAKREHAKNILPLFKKALKQAKEYKKQNNNLTTEVEREPELTKNLNKFIQSIKKPDIDLITVTTGPGLELTLWVGINFAKAINEVWNIPIIPVNHMEGHIFSIFPKKKKFKIRKVKFPIISLLISGGHTELVLIEDWGKYKVIGKTKDDAVGEAFDKVARMLDLPYPGGPEISKLAQKTKSPNFKLPRPMIQIDNFDFSFSGLKTAVLYKLKEKNIKKDEMAKEFEDAVVEVLVHKTKKAIKKYNAKTLIVGGGVSANQKLQKELKKLNIEVHLPPKGLSTDNALMIALAGYFNQKNSHPLKADGNWKL